MELKHSTLFDEHKVLHKLSHYLPSQTPLKDFIHHNSLHAFQQMKFYEAIFSASKIFGYQVTLQLANYRQLYRDGRISKEVLDKVIEGRKGKDALSEWRKKVLETQFNEHNEPRIGKLYLNWKKVYKMDMDTLVHPLLFRVLCSYLDQGISVWSFPVEAEGLLSAIRTLEQTALSSFFRTKRSRKMLLEGKTDLHSLLKIVVGDEAYFEQYLFDQQFEHRGWSGMAAVLENHPDALLQPIPITLSDLIALELLMEIDQLDYKFGEGRWSPLSTVVSVEPVNLFDKVKCDELMEVFVILQDAFEWSYYDNVLSGISTLRKSIPEKIASPADKSFQAVFCIDERECSLRRHVENIDKSCETLGMPGFFGVEFYFQAAGAKFIDKLAPAPVTPKHLIKEFNVKGERPHELMYTNRTHTLVGGYLSSFTFGFLAFLRLIQNLFSPKMSPAISNAFAHMYKESMLTVENKSPDDIHEGLQVGFTVDEMATRVENALRNIGLISDFAPIIYMVAHGSSSANNPHHGAHDCGACSGRPGSVNARVFSAMANHKGVRAVLADRGIAIPDQTQFIGALHDTAADQIEFYDESILSEANKVSHKKNVLVFESALNWNAKERSRRFASINTRLSLEKVREAIRRRSVSFFEPRPELGHGTNSICVIGNRTLTKGLFLDRRAFLNSYYYRFDPKGELLLNVMRPIGPVCGGINLEYYFSRVDNYKLGAGTKLPHNVMGLIGVANSSDGDLRPGLPLQMIEVHDPVRLLIIVEHFRDVVLETIKKESATYEWYQNEWVHLVALDPETGGYYYFSEGAFHEYVPTSQAIEIQEDFLQLIESAAEMETNHIVDATKENLPVYILPEVKFGTETKS